MNIHTLTDRNRLAREWVEKHADELYAWAYYKTTDEATAQDLVQETFLAALNAINSFRGGSNSKTWLFAILKRKVIDHHRQQYRDPVVHHNEKTSLSLTALFDEYGNWHKNAGPTALTEEENLLDNPEFKATLQACLGKLPYKWLSVIQLKYLEEKEGTHICQELEITPANYWQVLHRAKLQLRACLDTNWFKH